MTRRKSKEINCLLNFLLAGMLFVSGVGLPIFAFAGDHSYVVISEPGNGDFALSTPESIPFLLVDRNDHAGIILALDNLKTDIGRVTQREPNILFDQPGDTQAIVVVGSLDKSSLIAQLVDDRKIDVSEIKGKWEAFLIETVENPFPGIDRALVIVGSDKQSTIYGLYDLSEKMGVSPWYYWADVPIVQQERIYIKKGRYLFNGPKVKYRGIFINDEAPALSGWVHEKFGKFNSEFYGHVFELILRLKGNFLWPAMWGRSLFDDDPKSAPLADEMGIVVGTSHHEPMCRAQAEWHRYGSGPWDYTKNKKVLSDFWTEGYKNNQHFEQLVTIGMRGDGDEPMSEESNIELLERIIADQREIIQKTSGKKAEEVPQVWALYKEVQEYYDKGMRVPDDVTLLLCDDNWGNLRKLPDIHAPERKGGYGIYYHVDYVGGPRSSKWLNVSQISRIWEQMNLAYSHKVDRLWVLNVGDIKPMEFPISFFLDMAWDPDRFTASSVDRYTETWCARQFGENNAKEAARILDLYTKYNHRVTPELLDDKTYSLDHYNEFERVRNEYRDLAFDALRVYNFMEDKYRDAFDQLVLFPANATSNLYDMYYALAMNKKRAAENHPEANYWADVVEECFQRDARFTRHYNESIAGGKWSHMMDQIRIGYRSWAEPRRLVIPQTLRVEVPEIPVSERVFREADGYVSIEAENFCRAKGTDKITWEVIPGLGKTLSAVSTFPQNAYPEPGDSVYLEYAIQFETTGEFEVTVLLSPILNFNANKGLRYAVSFDRGKEQIVNFNGNYTWEINRWQANRINETKTKHKIDTKGMHLLRFRVLEPGIVLQKIMIDTGGLKPSYLGAPQSNMICR